MISKSDLQYYSSLLSKKYRKAENKFIVEGKKSVLEGLNSNYECEVVFVTNKFAEENEDAIAELANVIKKIVPLKQKEFLKIADTETPQEIAAVFLKSKLNISDAAFETDNIIVMLDNISDPGNLGTIIRNCDWFGVKNIFLSDSIVDYTNPKVVRASMGSVFHVKLFESINASKLDKMKSGGFEILCADMEGDNVFTYKNDKKKILILSSEAHGPSIGIEKISDKKICIPRIGKAESLNVASASAVLLAQLTK